MDWLERIAEVVGKHGAAARVVIIGTVGPTPRATGASMLVWPGSVAGKIGRGEAEQGSLAVARELICEVMADRSNDKPLWLRRRMEFSTGDVLGERTGGSISVLVEAYASPEVAAIGRMRGMVQSAEEIVRSVRSGVGPQLLAADGAAPLTGGWASSGRPAGEPRHALTWLARDTSAEAVQERLAPHTPDFYVYGTGLVARALVKLLADLPFRVIWLDTAPGHFPPVIPAGVEAKACADLADQAKHATRGSFHAVMTSAHDLDLGVSRSILAGAPTSFVGVIGSDLKRERLLTRLRRDGFDEATLAQIVCPIGLSQLRSKTPEVIAIGIAAQALCILQAADDLERTHST